LISFGANDCKTLRLSRALRYFFEKMLKLELDFGFLRC